MKLTVIVDDAPEGWAQTISTSLLKTFNIADLVVINGKVTKDRDGIRGRTVRLSVEEAPCS